MILFQLVDTQTHCSENFFTVFCKLAVLLLDPSLCTTTQAPFLSGSLKTDPAQLKRKKTSFSDRNHPSCLNNLTDQRTTYTVYRNSFLKQKNNNKNKTKNNVAK